MSRYKAGSKAAALRLRKHAEAQEKLAALAAERHAAEARLRAQEAEREAKREQARLLWAETLQISRASYRPDRMTMKQHAKAWEEEQAERARQIPHVQTIPEAPLTVPEPAPYAKPQPASPIATIGRNKNKATRATLHATAPGLWEAHVTSPEGSTGHFTVPFYQYERPSTFAVAQAVQDEITRRMSVAAAQPKQRKSKAQAARSPEPGDTAKIRRIERQMEGLVSVSV